MKAPRTNLACLALAALLVSGCLDSGRGEDEKTPTMENVRLLAKGAEMDIPVPVVLLGFPDDARDALIAASQNPAPVKGEWHESRYDHPSNTPEPTDFSTGFTLFPKYHFIQPAKDVEDAFFDMASNAVVATPGDITLYDANEVEEWLWQNFQSAEGGPTADTPGLVLIHSDGRLADSHAYRYTLNNGYMDRVRFFGEFHPQLIADISAEPTSFLGILPFQFDVEGDPTQTPSAPFDSPIRGVSAADADVLYQLLDAASHYRIMQGVGFPSSLERCVSIMALHAIEVGSPLDVLPTEQKQNQLLDPVKLNESFSALLAPRPTFVEVKVLVLPDDDPALYDALRNGGNVRLYMDQNWAKYAAVYDGCESYLSVFWQPLSGAAGGGVAYYSTQDDRYFSFTNLGELHRAQYGRTDTKYGGWDWGNDVVAHETGHLLGVRHPFDISDENPPFDGYLDSFSTIWSTMSYAPENKITTQFSAMDRNNLHRNRVGFQLMELQQLGLADGDDFDAGINAMSHYDWVAAETAFGRGLESAR